MRDELLMKNRVVPALNELYRKSQNIFQTDETNNISFLHIGYDEINTTIDFINNNKPNFDAQFILSCFYLDNTEQTQIIKKYTKNLKHYWKWPYKSQIIYSDEEISTMKEKLKTLDEHCIDYKMLYEKIHNNDEYKKQHTQWEEYNTKRTKLSNELDDNIITKKQYNSKLTVLAKEYGCVRRSRDAEAVRFSIWNSSPSCNYDIFIKYKNLWNEVCNVKRITKSEDVEHIVDLAIKNRNEDIPTYLYDTAKKYMINAYEFFASYLYIIV